MITSGDNQQIKNLSALINKPRERRKQGCFVVEGPRMCFEAPEDKVRSVYIAESFYAEKENQQKIQETFKTYEIVSDAILKKVSDTQTPQGIIAVVEMPKYDLKDLMKGDKTHLLILESIQDPGNLGTMVRTGEGAGITGIIMNKTTVDIFNPKTIRSTMGSLYRVPFIIVEDLPETLSTLHSEGVELYAAHLKGEKYYDQFDYTKACGFLIGNEGNGLSREIADAADTYIKIPMEGQLESLNAAISATLLMYECGRQRRNK